MSLREAGSSRSRRILSIWLPALAIDRWRVMADEHSRVLDRGPLVLIADTAHGPRIEAVNRAGAAAGAEGARRWRAAVGCVCTRWCLIRIDNCSTIGVYSRGG